MKIFVLAIIAGFLIGIGGTIYLSTDSKVLGSLFFSFGLLFVVVYQFKLYTGLVGYMLDNDKKTNFQLLIIIIGNFIGTFTVGSILRLTRIAPALSNKALALVNLKTNDTWYSILILAFFCGILMYLAVNTFYKAKTQDVKTIAIFLCVIVFAVSGFEHSIANMYYFTIANAWTLKASLYVVIMVIGNGLGSLFIPAVNKLIKKEGL
jgi:formate/nitrite transporter FocA (FNT family)